MNINIPSYSFVYNTFPNVVGGVGIYIKENISFNVVDKYDLHLKNCEDLLIELTTSDNIK